MIPGTVALTLAVCTWNRAARLRRLLTSIAAATSPDVSWELLVVDNNSTDATRAVAAERSDRLPIRYVFEPVQGLSAARNRAIAEARGDLLVFTDDDMTIDPSFLVAYASAASAHPEAAFFGGVIEVCFEAPAPGWIHLDPAILDGVFGRVLVDGVDTTIRAGGDTPYGGNFAFRRSQVGPISFDVKLGLIGERRIHGEESALFTRLMAGGAVGRWVPGAVVHHWIPPQGMTPAHVWRYFVGKGRTRVRMETAHPTLAQAAGASVSHLLRAGIRGAQRRPSWVTHLRCAAVALGELRELLDAARPARA